MVDGKALRLYFRVIYGQVFGLLINGEMKVACFPIGQAPLVTLSLLSMFATYWATKEVLNHGMHPAAQLAIIKQMSRHESCGPAGDCKADEQA